MNHEAQLYAELTASLSKNNKLIYAGTLLARAARLFPEKTAVIISPTESLTYEQLYQQASDISRYLVAQGIKPGDHVCLLAENSLFFYRAYWGIWQTGAIVIPLNVFLHQQELAHIMSDAKPHMFIISEKLAPKLQEVSASSTKIITEKSLGTIPTENKPFTPIERPIDELAALLYTSGTTGLPKGVMLSSRNILSNVIQGICRFNITSDERLFGALPLFHCLPQNTMVWVSCVLGATVILVPHISRTTLIEGLALKPTIIIGVPGLYSLFCQMKQLNFDNVRYSISGGDAVTEKIKTCFEQLYHRKLCNGYGLTEASPFVAIDVENEPAPLHCVGKPFINIECEIRDGITENNETVGILWIKGPNIMLGYYNAPQATESVLQDGWLNTGDLAKIDSQGRIIMCGREKDIIVNKGIKIYPQEIETILQTHPAVLLAAVIGVRKTGAGDEYPVAYVTLKEPTTGIEKILHDLCVQRIAAYKVPRQFIVVDALPLTSLGKINKKELRTNHAK